MIAIVGAALVLGMLSGAAAAAPVVHEKVTSAFAGTFKTECVEERARTLCTNTSLNIFSSDGTADACLSIFTFSISRRGVFEPVSVESGCASVAQDGFTFDAKDLSGATLEPTTITLQELDCDETGCQPTGESRDALVAATFSGVGELSTFRQNSKSTFGDCTFYFNGKGASRQADVSFTIDGQAVDPPGFLATSASKFKVICH